MKAELMRFIYFLIIIVLLGCRGSGIFDPPVTKPVSHSQLYFEFTDQQLDWVYNSRDTTYEIVNPVPKFEFEGSSIELQKMKVRGNSSANVRRKSFNVDTREKITFPEANPSDFTGSNDFRLVALHADRCYIENRMAYGLLKKAEIYPLYFNYVEVLLNQQTNGVYFFIENPNDYYLDKQNHAILLRRGYFGKVDSYKYSPNGDGFTEQEYLDVFNSIYSGLKDTQGEALFNQLDQLLDLRQYMQKIAFDYLIKNGDYTDEIYLYDTPGDGVIRFGVIPWDLDDLFAEKPHEIGNSYFTGNDVADRSYYSIDDVLADVGEKMIFSIEDDLDYIIAKDPYLYSVYLEELETLMNLITEKDIVEVFDTIEQKLESFFEYPKIAEQTSHDNNICDAQLLIEEINDKKMFLINRRQYILDRL